MYYTNEITIEMKDNTTATKALEILKARLEAGFDVDKNYRRNPSKRMAEALAVEENTIIIPEEDGFYDPYTSIDVNIELLKALATEMRDEAFTTFICNVSDCDEAQIEAEYENGTLTTTTTYYPNGYTEFLYCEECDAEIVELEKYDPNATYICPDCGEEIDMESVYEEWKPEITKKEFTI